MSILLLCWGFFFMIMLFQGVLYYNYTIKDPEKTLF